MNNTISSTSRTHGYRKVPTSFGPNSARELLVELVNLRDGDHDALSRFMSKFIHFLPAVPVELSQEKRIRFWQDQLRQAWVTSEFTAVRNPRWPASLKPVAKRRPQASVEWDRRGRLLSNLGFYCFHVPVPDGFYYMLEYACQSCGKMRRCQNGSQRSPEIDLTALEQDPKGRATAARLRETPDCPTPYFIARRRGQKFCSDLCAVVGQRESNLRWWRKRGAAKRMGKGRSKHVRPRRNK